MTSQASYVAPAGVILEPKNVDKGKNVFDYVKFYVCGMDFFMSAIFW